MRKSPVVLLVAALFLAGCTPAASTGTPAAAPLAADAPVGFERYYSQAVEFSPCQADQVTADMMPTPKDLKNYGCATVQAPLNWDDASSAPIELAVARYQPRGSGGDRPLLFFNLGGPGGDAVKSLSVFNEELVPPEVLKAYDVIAVDPRGTGASTPVTCWDNKGRDKFFSESDPSDENAPLDQVIADASAETAKIGAACQKLSGDVLGFVDTDSAVRDFDMVRALLGQPQMNYLGYSYGTALGATYADRFPTHVGRFVLDGALDPAVDINKVSALQAQGMEESLYHWVEACQQTAGCPLTGDLESGKQQLVDLLASIEKNPLPTSDPNRPLTVALARTGIVGSLYSEDSYEYLTEAVTRARSGDGSMLLVLADFYNGRSSDGTYSNMQDAFMAINSLDYEPVGTPQDWQAQRDRISADYPVLGPSFGLPSAGMDAWPVKPRVARAAVTAQGAPPILVIGTTHDPATPYVMAESLAKSLRSGVLLTHEGWGHGAYQVGGSTCVLDAVDGFLLKGSVPAGGTVCS